MEQKDYYKILGINYDSYRQSYGFFAIDKFRQTYTDQDIFKDSDINQVFAELSRIFGFNRPEDKTEGHGQGWKEWRRVWRSLSRGESPYPMA
jgi:hypothetical protein